MRELLREPWVQRGVRAALAAALAWQAAVLLPPALAQYAYYAPLGAVIAVHPTVADSAAAAWRTVLAILLGFGLAVAVQEVTTPIPGALTIALIVALAIGVEQWRVLREHASWVSFAAVLMLTVGTADPARYAVGYAGLTLLGAAMSRRCRASRARVVSIRRTAVVSCSGGKSTVVTRTPIAAPSSVSPA